MTKIAIVTGVLGMDGSTLTEVLLEKGYVVNGIYRRVSTGNNFSNVSGFSKHPGFNLVEGSITDYNFIADLIRRVQADEYYGLAANSHVGNSFKTPSETFRVNAEAVIAQLDFIRSLSPHTKFYNASTSEILGGIDCPPTGYDESAIINPRSPYAVSKAAAYFATKNYREAYKLFACSGILHNHDGPRRGPDFATRKITRGISQIVKGKAKHVFMGSLDTYRDIGHSVDYCKAMHLMLQQEVPDDYIIATGESVSIRQMFKYVCSLANLRFEDVYRLDERYLRPSDVPRLKGNPAKAKAVLGWEPAYDWKAILKEMYEHDLEQA